MTDKEQDKFLIKILKEILIELKDNAEYIKKYTTAENKDVAELNDSDIKTLEEILENISGIDDLAEMDEDYITVVFELIGDYAANFVIAPENQKFKYSQNMKTYKNLEEILYMFMDFDDDYSDE